MLVTGPETTAYVFQPSFEKFTNFFKEIMTGILDIYIYLAKINHSSSFLRLTKIASKMFKFVPDKTRFLPSGKVALSFGTCNHNPSLLKLGLISCNSMFRGEGGS